MVQTMRAFVMHGIGAVGYTEKPVPEPGPIDAVVTTRALVCTSDVHTRKGGIGERSNLTLEHEAVGVVAKLDSEVGGSARAIGCWSRRSRRIQLPELPARIHVAVRADAGRVEVRQRQGRRIRRVLPRQRRGANLTHIPDGIPDEVAVDCADMLSTGFMGAEHANIPLGGTVAVFAQEPVGLMATVGARLLGAGSDKVIRTGLCPGGSIRMSRLLRLIETGRVDPRPMTTHTFRFDQVDRALHLMESKEDGIIKPLITF